MENARSYLEMGIGVSAAALLGWLILHVTRVLLPKMIDGFSQALKDQRADFRATLESERNRFLEELSRERDRLDAILKDRNR